MLTDTWIGRIIGRPDVKAVGRGQCRFRRAGCILYLKSPVPVEELPLFVGEEPELDGRWIAPSGLLETAGEVALSGRVLTNKPLIEAVFELRWALRVKTPEL